VQTLLVGDGSCQKCCRLFPWNLPAKIFYWQDGKGYTGQEALEIHTFGSPPLLDAVVHKLIETKRVRLAHPGEFTQRAFLAGRLDLTQAEAVLGVIDAGNRQALKTALKQLAGGGLPRRLKETREQLLDAAVQFEASFEFPEEDIEFISTDKICQVVQETLTEAEDFRQKIDGRILSNEKPVVVLFGQPNAGKSTLFNALLGEERAMVSPIAGTTRDYLEAEVPFDGIRCTLIDTAGVSGTAANEIENVAEEYAKQLFERADLILYCSETDELPAEERQKENILHITRAEGVSPRNLSKKIAAKLRELSNSGDAVPSTAIRCRGALDTAIQALRSALQLAAASAMCDEAILAAELRIALNALGLLDGSVHTDDLLERIFSRFCVGK
jgi:tRNA modification GTPase